MINTDYIKQAIDCRQLIAHDLGEPKAKSGRSYNYRCPLHHETKGASLVVYQDGWICHGKCARSGDAISWMQLYHGMSFHDAAQALARNLGNLPLPAAAPRPHEPEPAEPPPAEWQQRARAVMNRAHDILMSSPDGQPGREYLAGRGLLPRIWQHARLGYIPGDPSRPYSIYGIGSIYPGIVIPWESDGNLWALNVRRLNATDERGKYLLAQGSHRRGALYGADAVGLHNRLPVLFVEGEFDALIVRQSADDLVNAVTLGSAGGKLHERWYGRIIESARLILVATDSDKAGAEARDRLAGLSARARVLHVPDGHKDVSDYYNNAGARPAGRVWDWLYDELKAIS